MPMTLDPFLYDGKEVPIRYDLTFRLDDDGPAFFFTAPMEAVIERCRRYRQDSEETDGLVVSRTNLGFGSVFQIVDPLLPIKGFASWKATIPEKVIVPRGGNWLPAKQLATTISMLTAFLRFPVEKTPSTGIQQLAIHMLACSSDNPLGGYGLSTTLSPIARDWIEKYREVAEDIAQDAMFLVYNRMFPGYFKGSKTDVEYARRSFRVCALGMERDKGISFRVPGNACDLSVDGIELDEGPGWHLDCHNVDSPLQQLALLAGICSMVNMIRQLQFPNR